MAGNKKGRQKRGVKEKTEKERCRKEEREGRRYRRRQKG
jgi:hypothetical protein